MIYISGIFQGRVSYSDTSLYNEIINEVEQLLGQKVVHESYWLQLLDKYCPLMITTVDRQAPIASQLVAGFQQVLFKKCSVIINGSASLPGAIIIQNPTMTEFWTLEIVSTVEIKRDDNVAVIIDNETK